MKSGKNGGYRYATTDFLLPLVQKFRYLPLTVLFDADIKILHRRFCERDMTDERHSGLSSNSNPFNDFDYFSNATLPLRDFSIGEKFIVDTTDFSKVDYGEVDAVVKKFIGIANEQML